MALNDLSDPQAVRRAVAEYDQLGAIAFLEKYGFGAARAYHLEIGTARYPSKAIVGAAHGYQFPTQGPLKAADFSGGENTVAHKLQSLGFSVVREGKPGIPDDEEGGQRNPPWNRDELILALDAYVRWKGNPPAKTSPDIAALSVLLNQLRRVLGTETSPTLRNANGVYMKLMNLRRFDPAFVAQGKAGLRAGNRLEEEIWNEFHAEPQRLALVVSTIKAGIREATEALGSGARPMVDDLDGVEAVEGAIATRLHKVRERNRKLVERKKAEAFKLTGKLACEVCGFHFPDRYGERGAGFIECHHTKPIETLGDGTPTKLADLALLCANCHRMVHARRPWLTIRELRSLYLR